MPSNADWSLHPHVSNSPHSLDMDETAAVGIHVCVCVDTTGAHGHPLLTENTHVTARFGESLQTFWQLRHCHSVCDGPFTSWGSISAYIKHMQEPLLFHLKSHTHTHIKSMCSPLASDTNIWECVGRITANWFLLFVNGKLKGQTESSRVNQNVSYLLLENTEFNRTQPKRSGLLVEMLYSAINLPLIASHVHNLVCLTAKCNIFIRSCWGVYDVLSSLTRCQWYLISTDIWFLPSHLCLSGFWHIATHGQIYSICAGETRFQAPRWNRFMEIRLRDRLQHRTII